MALSNETMRKASPRLNSFEDCDRLYRETRQRKIGNNTYLLRVSDDAYGIQLHGTIVVTYYRDGRVRFDSGGWYTVTTKARMNQHAPTRFYISQRKRQWYLNTPSGEVDYRDGLTVQS